ncbi:hypothetical protein BHE74_00014081 [Ensete ventricosum]|nr:hypothetical protein BHE74_00014081 [Ensete ventricosum]
MASTRRCPSRSRTDRPASLYAATTKAGEEITHTYNHIYGLSITGLRFFTANGPWGRPDMAYFSFTRNILQGKPITAAFLRTASTSPATSPKSTTGGRKRGPAQYRIYNLGNTSPVKVPTPVRILERHLKVKAMGNVVEMAAHGDVPFTHAKYQYSSCRARLQSHHQPRDRPKAVRQVVRLLLRLQPR